MHAAASPGTPRAQRDALCPTRRSRHTLKLPELGEISRNGDTTAPRNGSKEGAAQLSLGHGSSQLSTALALRAPGASPHSSCTSTSFHRCQRTSLAPALTEKMLKEWRGFREDPWDILWNTKLTLGVADSESSTHTSHQQGWQQPWPSQREEVTQELCPYPEESQQHLGLHRCKVRRMAVLHGGASSGSPSGARGLTPREQTRPSPSPGHPPGTGSATAR